MRHIGSLLCALAAVLVVAPAQAKDEKVPPEVAAKRSGKVKQATPSPLDMVFSPIAPCRAFYTPSAVAAGSTTTFQITGSGSFASQGGPANGCGIPASAKAVAISLSAVNPSSNGSFKAYGAGSAFPPTTALNYRANINETGGATVGLGTNGRMSVFSASGTRIIGDVTGYYAPQLWAYVGRDGEIIDSSGRASAITRLDTGIYTVTFDRNLTPCVGLAGTDLAHYGVSVSTLDNMAYVYIRNGFGPGAQYVDYWFNIHIKC